MVMLCKVNACYEIFTRLLHVYVNVDVIVLQNYINK